jgi:hypothetical protein
VQQTIWPVALHAATLQQGVEGVVVHFTTMQQSAERLMVHVATVQQKSEGLSVLVHVWGTAVAFRGLQVLLLDHAGFVDDIAEQSRFERRLARADVLQPSQAEVDASKRWSVLSCQRNVVRRRDMTCQRTDGDGIGSRRINATDIQPITLTGHSYPTAILVVRLRVQLRSS